jgi:hypothetical protein
MSLLVYPRLRHCGNPRGFRADPLERFHAFINRRDICVSLQGNCPIQPVRIGQINSCKPTNRPKAEFCSGDWPVDGRVFGQLSDAATTRRTATLLHPSKPQPATRRRPGAPSCLAHGGASRVRCSAIAECAPVSRQISCPLPRAFSVCRRPARSVGK